VHKSRTCKGEVGKYASKKEKKKKEKKETVPKVGIIFSHCSSN
jgi:hypothetical protein